MSDVWEIWAWGEDWSPITVVGTGTVITTVYYPHKATADVIMTMRGLPVHCLICDSDVEGTKPHTRHDFHTRALVAHLKAHGKRTRRRNGFIERRQREASGGRA